jgi:phosphoribosyl 1,2-cyclic phosphate phosphodiesterase
MRLRLLGSAAGKTVPRPFCKCRVCDYAKSHAGPDRRTRTAMHLFLDGEPGPEPRFQVDLPPDTGHQMIRDGFCLDRLEHLLFTHADPDHFDPSYLVIRLRIMSDRDGLTPLRIYGPRNIYDRLAALNLDFGFTKLSFHEVLPFQAFRMGELDVFSFPAPHGPHTCHYVLQDGRCAVLLAWDTGYYRDEAVWDALSRFRLDAVFMECTHLTDRRVKDRDSGTHMDFPLLLEMRERLLALGSVRPETPFVAMHIGDNGGLLHAEAVELASEHGVTVAYDGFEMVVP